MHYIVVSNYSDHYNDPIPEDKLHYIRNYPTDFIMLKLSKINAILFQEKNLNEQTKKILVEVIFAGTPQATSNLTDLITNDQLNNKIFFSSASISLLIKSCLENLVEEMPDQTVNTTQLARDFFKTILIFNQIYYSQIHGYDLESFRGVFKLEIMQQSYIRSNFYSKIVTIMKFAFISKFLAENESTKVECLEYCKYFGIGNPWLFGKFFLDVLTFASMEDKTGKHILDTTGLPLKLINDFILNKEIVKGKAFVSLNVDVVPKPFYMILDKYPLILDYNYFQYAIEHGVFYSFYQNTSLKNGDRFKTIMNLKAISDCTFLNNSWLVNIFK